MEQSGWEPGDRPEVRGDARCARSTALATNATFRNRYFCTAASGGIPSTTYTVYAHTVVYGMPNGTMRENWRARKAGSCTELLHYDSIRVNDYTP